MPEPFVIYNGDSVEVLALLPENSVDAVVTDPPYGLSKNPDASEVLSHWLAGDDYVASGGGFMGKSWDSFVPGPALWKQVYRVLKPGGHLIAFAGTRTHDLMGMAIRLAGFEIRDGLTWLYGSGMPKGLDIAKSIDKKAGHWRGKAGAVVGQSVALSGPAYERVDKGDPITPEAIKWAGWDTALKPSYEPITLARKPVEGSITDNVLEWGTGAINIDATRIGTTVETWPSSKSYTRFQTGAEGKETQKTGPPPPGRWTPNTILGHSDECIEIGTRIEKGHPGYPNGPGGNRVFSMDDDTRTDAWEGHPDQEVPNYACVEDCPVRIIDEQSGAVRSAYGNPESAQANAGKVLGEGNGVTGILDNISGLSYSDSGGASRFFYHSKSNVAEREKGMRGHFPCLKCGGVDTEDHEKGSKREKCRRNTHPTVKPVDVMEWLVKLVTPPGGTVLDPFSGSGSTGIAAVKNGFRYIGIDQEPLYAKISEVRCRAWTPQGAKISTLPEPGAEEMITIYMDDDEPDDELIEIFI